MMIFKYFCGNDVEVQYYEEIYQLMIIDGLMQVSNCCFLIEFFECEVVCCGCFGLLFFLIFFDIDNFKMFNDEYGYFVGDWILCSLVVLVDECVCCEQFLVCYGGDEFVVVLFDIGFVEVLYFVQKICELIVGFEFQYEGDMICMLVSVGFVMMFELMQVNDFFQFVDEVFYEFKGVGRNCVYVVDSVCFKVVLDLIKNWCDECGFVV